MVRKRDTVHILPPGYLCHSMAMEFRPLFLAVVALGLLTAAGANTQKTYRWVDDEGVVHFGDYVPPEFSDKEKSVLNEQGVHVGRIRGRKTAEELAEEVRMAKVEEKAAQKRRADQALLATYLTVEEIEMHRDRRIELVRAQVKVTELYLMNLQRRLDWLQEDASKFQPYSDDPDAPPMPVELVEDIDDTKRRMARYELVRQDNNTEAENISARFEHDINRFKKLRAPRQASRT